MFPSTRLRKVNLAAQAYESIRNLILDQDIRPGDPIGIDTLAASLGVSPTPIREALARLEGDRLVVRLDSGRYRAAPELSLKDFADLYDVRLIMEPVAAALAARNRSDETAMRLRALVGEIALAGRGPQSQDFAEFVEIDRVFHLTIAEAGDNSFLASTMAQLQANLRVGPYYRGRGVIDAEVVIGEHALICEAIASRDEAAAEAAMREHITRARDQLLEWMAAREGAPPARRGSPAPNRREDA
ncbi:MAG: GntR family transcriptional regulator [Rhizobiales bacterium]|nr:GntR family transcriptional regulator [Hyphomicrobiales bacterium]